MAHHPARSARSSTGRVPGHPRRWRAVPLVGTLLVALATAGGSAAAAQGSQSPLTPDVAEGAAPVGQEPGASLRIWLVTAAPGTAVWERFGHNAIRVLDTRSGRDVSYNWGIFDFDQVDFVPRFLRGEMLYMMAAFPTGPMIDSYLGAGRPVRLQELALTPTQKAELRDFLEWNALPENRDYFYDYFLDNCSTRARDALDDALGGALRARFAQAETGTSYRFHTRRLTRMDPLVYTGMDLLLGSPGDQPVTVWEEMFLPMTLAEELPEVAVTDPDGPPRPLVVDDRVLLPDGTVAETPLAATDDDDAYPWGPPAPPSRFVLYLALGLGLGALVGWSGGQAARASAAAPSAPTDDGTPASRLLRVAGGAMASVWSLAAGFVGTILVLVLFTDHQFMAWNENLFLFNPLSLGLVALAPLALAGRTGIRAARALGWAVAGVAVVGLLLQLLPWSRQENAIFFALALPVHLALAWALERRAALATP